MPPPAMQQMMAAPTRLPHQPHLPPYHSQPLPAHSMRSFPLTDRSHPSPMDLPFAAPPARNGHSSADGRPPARAARAAVWPGLGSSDAPPPNKKNTERAGGGRARPGVSVPSVLEGPISGGGGAESKPRRAAAAPAAKRHKTGGGEEEEGYAYEWRPPPRRERGSRGLGDVVSLSCPFPFTHTHTHTHTHTTHLSVLPFDPSSPSVGRLKAAPDEGAGIEGSQRCGETLLCTLR
jgi:hypothetical protein